MLNNLETATNPTELGANKVKILFLTKFEETPNIYRLAKQMGISRQVVYEWMEEDPDFKRRLDAQRGIVMEGSRCRQPRGQVRLGRALSHASTLNGPAPHAA